MSAKYREDVAIRQVGKISWHGVIDSVQPRIRLLRSFDQRSHTYLGYVLHLQGTIGGETRELMVAIGESAHAKHRFQAGDEVSGQGVCVADRRTETAELYKVSELKLLKRGQGHQPGTASLRSFPCIASAATADSTPGPTAQSAQRACGVAGCPWR